MRCCLLEIGWPRPLPTGPTHSTGGAGYHCSIYILNLSYFQLRHLISSSFQYLILTYILVTYFSIHACLAWNHFLHLILPVTLLLVGGWMKPTPSQGPPIPHGGGGLMGYDHDHGRGLGGNPEPGTYINDYEYRIIKIKIKLCFHAVGLHAKNCGVKVWWSCVSNMVG